MNKPNDGVPDAAIVNERSKRTTTEFCDERHDGFRCSLTKGHAGVHESVAKAGIARWASHHHTQGELG